MAFWTLTGPAEHPARFYILQGIFLIISGTAGGVEKSKVVNINKGWYIVLVIVPGILVVALELWKRRADYLDKQRREKDKKDYEEKIDDLESEIADKDLKDELMSELLTSSNRIVNGKASRFGRCALVHDKDTFLSITQPKKQIQKIAEEFSQWLESSVNRTYQFKIAVALFRGENMTGMLAFTHGSASSPSLKNPAYFPKSFFATTLKSGKDLVIIPDIAVANADARANGLEEPYFETPGAPAEGSIVGMPIKIADKGTVLVVTIKSAAGVISEDFVEGNDPVIEFYRTRISMESCLVWLRREKLDKLEWDDQRQLEEEYV